MITETYMPHYKITYIEGFLFDLKRMYQEIVDHRDYFIGCCSAPSIVGNRVQGGVRIAPQEKLMEMQETCPEFVCKVRQYRDIIEGLDYLRDYALDEDPDMWEFVKLRYFHCLETKDICDQMGQDRNWFYRLREKICVILKPYMPAP